MSFAAPIAYLNTHPYKDQAQTTQHDRRARSASMGNRLQHEIQIATLQSRSKSCKHLPSSTLPEQPDSCPHGHCAGLLSTDSHRSGRTRYVGGGHESCVADPALSNCNEVWLGLGQRKILKERPLQGRINIRGRFTQADDHPTVQHSILIYLNLSWVM